MSQLTEAPSPDSQAVCVPPELAVAVEYSRAMAGALPEATIMVIGADERVWHAAGSLLTRAGRSLASLTGAPLRTLLPVETSDSLYTRYEAALRGERQSFDYGLVDGTGILWIQITPIELSDGTVVGITAVMQDVTERHRLTRELEREQERRSLAQDLAGVLHWELDLEEGRIAVVDGSTQVLGPDPLPLRETPLDAFVRQFIPSEDHPRLQELVARALADGEAEIESGLFTLRRERRRVLMRARPEIREGRTWLLGATIDVTALRETERALRESEALFRQGFDASPLGLAITDPVSGRYIRVNDALCRLLCRSREELLELSVFDVTDPDDLAIERDGRGRLASGEAEVFECEKRYQRRDGSSVWVSLHLVPVLGADRQPIAFFSQVVDLTTRKQRELELMQEASDLERLAVLRAGLADDRLTLYAQPIIDVGTGEIVQQELLVRLLDEQGHIVPPGHFLPVAERYGLIGTIDEWVVDRAVEIAAGGQPVEVNLSAASVGDPAILATIRAALARSGAEPSLLVFEVTETALMADLEQGRRFAEALRALGCRFALDDFGTGYGTFTYLKHIPIDYLKIDMEFVRELAANESDQRIVRAIVTMATELGKQTIAEGVEDEEALTCLRELGVDHAQGYHLGRPAPIAQMVR